jgi:hypothetical protein
MLQLQAFTARRGAPPVIGRSGWRSVWRWLLFVLLAGVLPWTNGAHAAPGIWRAVSADGDFSCAIRGNDTARCWGNNTQHQTEVPNDLGTVTTVSAGGTHACAIRSSDSTLRCWGGTSYGQATLPGDLGSVVAVGTGYYHTCAIRSSDSTLRCWGRSNFGQTTVPIPPEITAQPQSQLIVIGAPVQLTVAATGEPAPSYQWRKNGVPIPGATSASYVIASARFTDAGRYDVLVSNSEAIVPSANAILRVRVYLALLRR